MGFLQPKPLEKDQISQAAPSHGEEMTAASLGPSSSAGSLAGCADGWRSAGGAGHLPWSWQEAGRDLPGGHRVAASSGAWSQATRTRTWCSRLLLLPTPPVLPSPTRSETGVCSLLPGCGIWQRFRSRAALSSEVNNPPSNPSVLGVTARCSLTTEMMRTSVSGVWDTSEVRSQE